MIVIEQSELGTALNVKINDQAVKATIVQKPFYDPKKKLAAR